MPEVIGVKYNATGKIYFFDPNGEQFNPGDYVIIEDNQTLDIAKVVVANKNVSDDEIVSDLKKIKRKANEFDLAEKAKNDEERSSIMKIAFEKCQKCKLEIKIVDATRSFDGKKITIYFAAEGRVDFRDLVKELATYYHVRIELRQIYEKEEVKMLGGLGHCGQVICCARFLKEPTKTSMKMAKMQSVNLNANKTSGYCGKMMCCLEYENKFYEEQMQKLPAKKSIVKTPAGKGVVLNVNPLTEMVDVKIEQDDNIDILKFHASELIYNKTATVEEMLED